MKRRWQILFYAALMPLIGLSWIASQIGFSMWSMFNVRLLAMIVAAAVAGFAMVRVVPRKWPAIVVLVTSLPMAHDVIRSVHELGELWKYLGLSFLLIVVGSLATAIAAIVVLALPVPPPPRDPDVAPARVVD